MRSKNVIPLAKLLIAALLLFIAGCTASNPTNVRETSRDATQLYAGFGGCDFPCWAGIVPGRTTASEAQNILSSRYGPENVVQDRDIAFDWNVSGQNSDISGRGSVYFSDGMVSSIDLTLAQEITVKELIERLGELSFVRLSFTQNPRRCWGGELFYPSISTVAQLDTGNYVTVSENQLLVGFQLLSMDGMNDTMTMGFDVFDIEWKGYRDYCASP